MSEAEQTRLQWEEARRWFAKADEDIVMARMALAHAPPLVDPAAFHCQQAAEKLIKGLLTAAAVAVPRVHDIELLSTRAAPLYPGLKTRMDSFAVVSAWTIASRYPDLGGGLGTDAAEVAEMLSAISDFRREAAAMDPTGA